MATEEDRLQQKRDNAISVLNSFAAFLDDHDLSQWSPRFREIAATLEQGDDRKAIDLHKTVSRGGMGSLGDIYVYGVDGESNAEADRRFHELTGLASRAIANVRLYLDYEMDRPIVDV